MNRIASAISIAALAFLVLPGIAEAKDPKVYDTPDAAAADLIAALGAGTRDAITDVLGDQHNDELFTQDESMEKENRERAFAAAKEKMSLRADADNKRTILIGKQEWPVPFPIVKVDKGWTFDTEAGIYELLARRIGGDELAAIAALRTFVQAERDYQSEDRDADQVLEYAQKFVSTPGTKDGLYWDVDPNSNEEASPLAAFVTAQGGYLEGRDQGDPVRGYRFRILTRQDEGAPGGRYDYIINGNMIGGFAAIATPSDYGETGVMTFIVNQQGKVYEKDLGDDTELEANKIQSYNLDSTWQLSKDQTADNSQ
ncbi:MAG TPA: DUF2950 family protein [Candidatus Cybelea sp.]|nr:DUF2950 family protein [Candidatus Cybelea sp.]